MRKSWAEYKREERKRKAEAAKLAGDPTDAIADISFDLYLADESNWSIVEESLASVGIEPPAFDADTDDEWSEEWGIPYRGSIGRAERMVGAFLDAATELSTAINNYKRRVINNRMLAIENANILDPFEKMEAEKEHQRLRQMLGQLDKQVRWSFPQCVVTGE